jgi:hypothetical protein
MFTPERIPELQGTGELSGSNQKSRAIDLPFTFYFPHFVPPLGEGRLLGVCFSASCLGWIFCEGEKESTRDPPCGQSQNCCAILKFVAANFPAHDETGEGGETRSWSDDEPSAMIATAAMAGKHFHKREPRVKFRLVRCRRTR